MAQDLGFRAGQGLGFRVQRFRILGYEGPVLLNGVFWEFAVWGVLVYCSVWRVFVLKYSAPHDPRCYNSLLLAPSILDLGMYTVQLSYEKTMTG